MRRLLTSACGTAGSVALALALASQAFAQATPELTGKVKIAGDTVGYAPVRLSHEVPVVSASDGPLFKPTFKGPGRLQAVMLRSEAADSEGNHYSVFSVRLPEGGSTSAQIDADGGLPPGDYRLYLIFDRGPAEVGLTLGDGSGTVTVTPSVAVPADVGELPARQSRYPNTALVGRTGRLVTDGVMFFAISAEFAGGAGRFEDCFYPGGDGGAGGAPYEPTCPGGISFDDPPFDVFLPGDSLSGTFEGEETAGVYGYGANAEYVGEAPKLSILGAWVSFGGPPPLAPALSTPAGRWLSVDGAARVRSRRAFIRVSCAATQTCKGRARLIPRGVARRFSVPAGTTRTVSLAVPVRLARTLRRVGHVRAAIQVTGVVGGQRRAYSSHVTLRGHRG